MADAHQLQGAVAFRELLRQIGAISDSTCRESGDHSRDWDPIHATAASFAC